MPYISGRCDKFQFRPFEVPFPTDKTTVMFPINIADDDVYEGDESFILTIEDSLPSLVSLGTRYRATVVIKDDEESKLIILLLLHTCVLFQACTVNAVHGHSPIKRTTDS